MVFFASSKAKIFVKYLETSTTIPSPTHCPASEVPAVLGIMVSLFFVANSMIVLISSAALSILTSLAVLVEILYIVFIICIFYRFSNINYCNVCLNFMSFSISS
mgnify:CR=1 FL=1